MKEGKTIISGTFIIRSEGSAMRSGSCSIEHRYVNVKHIESDQTYRWFTLSGDHHKWGKELIGTAVVSENGKRLQQVKLEVKA